MRHRRRHRRRPLLATLAVLAAASAPRLPRAQTGPQPRLPEEPLVIVARDGTRHAFRVEMAVSPEHQAVGLMFRERIGPDEGMLFDWGVPRESSMWMRNTLVPLDMLFIAADGRIINIAANTKPRSTDTILSQGPAKGVLEIAGGTARLLGIKPGDVVLYRVFGTAK
jgi:uncharacterized membrane protein (UPF0127 family)